MRIGIVGGGQLGRMLALAGTPLGMRFVVADEHADAPASSVAEVVCGDPSDPATLARLAARVDVVTFENEHIDSGALADLPVPVRPSPGALGIVQDRLTQKQMFMRLGIRTAPFAAVSTAGELPDALAVTGAAAVIKTRRGGYDGRGQAVIERASDAAAAWDAVGRRPAIVESRVRFRRELSVVAVRGEDGRIEIYDPAENRHENGILRVSVAPAPIDERTRAEAAAAVRAIGEHLGCIGAFALEMFDTPAGLVANELALRVHNTGHWTIEGAETSQFENHLRAVAGLPLGSAASLGHRAIVNLIGDLPDPAEVLALPSVRLHVYGKTVRPGRKVGHVSVGAADPAGLAERLASLRHLPGAS
ncbi:MAG TPA: 5-(carboxyamino)imidazole ribonucleotide synthase [Actinomycetota bacterium]|nr:5-(carboxyamino)imidazole ribonucleotide synthase [Actinomycetota bacterium]